MTKLTVCYCHFSKVWLRYLVQALKETLYCPCFSLLININIQTEFKTNIKEGSIKITFDIDRQWGSVGHTVYGHALFCCVQRNKGLHKEVKSTVFYPMVQRVSGGFITVHNYCCFYLLYFALYFSDSTFLLVYFLTI